MDDNSNFYYQQEHGLDSQEKGKKSSKVAIKKKLFFIRIFIILVSMGITFVFLQGEQYATARIICFIACAFIVATTFRQQK